MTHRNNKKCSPWAWIPTLYFAEGIPYVAVMTISVIMYKNLGLNNSVVALYTGFLYLPWVIKPLWSPIVDIFKSKKWWIISMQLLIAIAFAGVSFTLYSPHYIPLTLACFWVLAFSSATHDIAADGFYMLGLSQNNQAKFVGIRSTFYRIATIFGQGALVVFAGYLATETGRIKDSWSATFALLGLLFLFFFLYHRYTLPRTNRDEDRGGQLSLIESLRDFFSTFSSFFTKKGVVPALLFMLFYRLPEAFVVKMINPFLLDPIAVGGLGLSTKEVGFVYGTWGVLGLTIGGILGGLVVAKGGLKKWLWPMALSIILPCFVYVYLATIQTTNLNIINFCIILDQFGYGFGFTAYMLYLIYFSQGESQTAHYAICTGFMALGMMLPGMVAGYIQEALGYKDFFWFIMACSIPALLATGLIKIDPHFGLKEKTEHV